MNSSGRATPVGDGPRPPRVHMVEIDASPDDKIEVLRTARVRRAKLYFLRDLKGKAARMKEQKKV